jgi:hypothetical protein
MIFLKKIAGILNSSKYFLNYNEILRTFINNLKDFNDTSEYILLDRGDKFFCENDFSSAINLKFLGINYRNINIKYFFTNDVFNIKLKRNIVNKKNECDLNIKLPLSKELIKKN